MLISPAALSLSYGVPTGIIQVGAHYGQEYFPFKEVGVNNFIMIEAVPRHCKEMSQRIKDNDVKILQTALGNQEGSIQINLSEFEPPPWGLDPTDNINNYRGQSSSILKPKEHLDQYPHIKFENSITVPITTLDSLVLKEKIDLPKYDMLNIDVQGYELEVLKGSTNTLSSIKYIYTEVNKSQVYENCAQIGEMDDFLKKYGFHRELINWEGGDWGDALYIR